MKALLLIDIQNDFLPGGALAVPGGDEIIPIVNKLQSHFDLVVATQDWHPYQHKSFASSHSNNKVYEVIRLNNLPQVLWPSHCLQGTAGADFSKELNMNPVEAIFRKGTDPEIDSYSGFFDNGHQKNTGLSAYLKGREVTDVYVCGLAGDYCVYYTAKDAIQEGFKTNIIEDATRAISEEGFQRAKEDVISMGGKIVQSKTLL